MCVTDAWLDFLATRSRSEISVYDAERIVSGRTGEFAVPPKRLVAFFAIPTRKDSTRSDRNARRSGRCYATSVGSCPLTWFTPQWSEPLK
jgi:hypothetical protein